MKMNETEKLAFDIALQKINDFANDLKLNKQDIEVITKIAAIRHGKPLKSPLMSAELTLKELVSLASRGEVAPGEIELNLTGVSDFLASDKEYLDKVKEEINSLIEGESDA